MKKTLPLFISLSFCFALIATTLSAQCNFTNTPSITNTYCGNSNGAISLITTGGTPPYTYAWSNASFGSTIDNLYSGLYSVTITDAMACTATASYTVTDLPSNLALSLLNYAPSCGTFTYQLTGGLPLYYNNAGAVIPAQGTISNLNPGVYNFYASDSQGCMVTQSVLIYSNAPSITTTVTPSTCMNDGTATVDTLGLTYAWSNGQTTRTISGLAPGYYTVTATNANGCTATASAFVPYNTITPTFVLSPPCVGISNGSISISNAVAGYTYVWNTIPSQATTTATGLSPGTYTVTASSALGCTATANATLNTITAIITGPGTVCTGANATLTASGANTYDWSTPTGAATSTSIVLNNITAANAGTYIVTAVASNGCTATASYLLSLTGGSITSPILSSTPISCYGSSDGSISINNPVAGYTYQWSDGSTTPNITGLDAGTYTVTAMNSTGCMSTASTTLSNPAPLYITYTTTPTSCTVQNGSINLTANGGTAPYSYSWSDGQNIEDPMNLAEGYYTVYVSDANGCTTTASAFVQGASITPPTFTTIPTCLGTNSGSISINNPVAGYTYLWSTAATTTSLTGLGVGTYVVTVSNTSGCTITASVFIPNSSAINTTATPTPSCNNQPNGTIILNSVGGTAPYFYAWSQGILSGNVVDSLLAGTYNISITDANSCTATVSAIVPTYTQQVTFTGNTILCPNTFVTINAACATGNCYYTWSNLVNSATVNITEQGTYFVTMTDANGCTAATSIYIDSVPVCTNNPPIANYDLGNTFQGVNLNGNVLSNDYDFEGQTLIANIQPVTPPIGGTLSLNGNGQFTYYPSSSFVGLDSFQYAVCDAGTPQGCDTGWVYINVQACFGLSSLQITPVNCSTGYGSLLAIVNNAPNPLIYTYTDAGLPWPTVGPFASMIPATIYGNVFIMDTITGCTMAISDIVIPTGYQNLTPSNVVLPSCQDNNLQLEYAINGTPQVDITGGNNWQVSYNPLHITLAPDANDYIVSILINGCGDVDTFHVDGVANPVYHPSYNCATGLGEVYATIGANAVQPINYYWDNNSTDTFAVNLSLGTHSVTVTNGDGCVRVDQFQIAANPLFGLNANIVQDTCSNGVGQISLSLTGTPTGAVTYLWSNSSTTSSISGLQANNYIVTATDVSGCQVTATYNVANNSGFSLQMSSQAASCSNSNGAASVAVSGNYTMPLTYLWSNNASSAYISGSAGTYTVSVSDASGCTVTGTVTIGSIVPFSALVQTNSAYCGLANGSATVNLSGSPASPITYAWDNTQSTASATNLLAGNHQLTVSDGNGCALVETFTIGNGQSFGTNAITQATYCGQANGSILISITGSPLGAIQYTWAAPLSGNTPSQSNLNAGFYTVTITDGSCTQVKSIQVTNSNYFNFNIAATTTDCNTNTGTATPTNIPSYISNPVYNWSNGANTPTLTSLAQGGYSLTITSGSCVAHQNVVISRDPSCYVHISGRVLDDNINQTCVTNTQLGIENKHIYITGPNNYSAHDYTDAFGNYNFNAPVTGTFNIQLLSTVNANEVPYIPICFTQRSLSAPAFNTNYTGNDFYMKLDTFRNLRCHVTSAQGTNQGIPREYTICTKNLGGVPQDGISSLTWDSHLSNFFPIATPSTLDLLNNTVSYNVPILQPGQELCRTLRLAVDPSTAIGTNLYSLGASLPISWDRYPLNNYAPYYQTVTGSYDPNDKSVSPAGDITASDSILTYTIRFQNVGNDTAFNITIRDTLNAASYDLNTIHPISWSHNFDLNMEGDNILVFNFDNIRLVDSFRNEPASHGYVSFTIRRKSDLPIGARISNRASIYFDYNEPVHTNAATNDIINGVSEVIDHSIPMTIMPNPSNGTSVLVYDLAESNTVTLSVTDALGRSIYTPILQEFQQAGQHAYDLSKLQLPAGLWFVSLRTNEGNSAVSRWLIVD